MPELDINEGLETILKDKTAHVYMYCKSGVGSGAAERSYRVVDRSEGKEGK